MFEIQAPQRLASRPRHGAKPERVSWSAAIAAGFFAGSVLLGMLVLLGVVIYDESPWKLLRMMAATVRGEGALSPDDAFDLKLVTLGVSMHFALSLLYALALAGLLVDFRRWFAPWVGLAFGVALYFANLHGFTHIFSWFAELRTPDTLIAHALFGLLLARAYCALASAPSSTSR